MQLLHARVVDEEISSLSEGFAGFAQKKLNEIEVKQFFAAHGRSGNEEVSNQGKKTLQLAVPGSNRRLSLNGLGKGLLLSTLLLATTLVLGGQAVSASTPQAVANSVLTVPAEGLAPEKSAQASVLAEGQQSQSNLAGMLGIGAVIFWLGLAAVNLRRRGVKDFRADNRVASPAAVGRSSVVSG